MSQKKTDFFEEIFHQYFQMVKSLLFRLGREADLEDCIQEVFLRIWKSLDSFSFRSNLKTWVYRITLNVAYDAGKKASRNRSLFQALTEESATDRKSDSAKILREILFGMPEDKKSLLVLHYFEGLTESELQEVLQVPLGTVKSRIYHAKKELKNRLIQNGVGGL